MIFTRLVVLGFMVGLRVSSSRLIPNLRRYRITGTIGRFVVSRDTLEEVIKTRTTEDANCGKDVSLSLPKSLPSARFNHTLYSELYIAYTRVEEKDLEFLPCNLKDELNTTFQMLYVAIPYISNGNHGLLAFAVLTEPINRLTPSFATNDEYRINVDEIKEDEETVTLRIGNDTMTLEALKNTSCHTDEDVGKDFDQVYGPNVTLTNYPKRFDWDCGSRLVWDTGYCHALKDNLCEIEKYDGDVCIHATTTRSVRCQSKMKITSVNGVFRDIFWGMLDDLPADSFETEWIDRDHGVGIKFPCLTTPDH